MIWWYQVLQQSEACVIYLSAPDEEPVGPFNHLEVVSGAYVHSCHYACREGHSAFRVNSYGYVLHLEVSVITAGSIVKVFRPVGGVASQVVEIHFCRSERTSVDTPFRGYDGFGAGRSTLQERDTSCREGWKIQSAHGSSDVDGLQLIGRTSLEMLGSAPLQFFHSRR